MSENLHEIAQKLVSEAEKKFIENFKKDENKKTKFSNFSNYVLVLLIGMYLGLSLSGCKNLEYINNKYPTLFLVLLILSVIIISNYVSKWVGNLAESKWKINFYKRVYIEYLIKFSAYGGILIFSNLMLKLNIFAIPIVLSLTILFIAIWVNYEKVSIGKKDAILIDEFMINKINSESKLDLLYSFLEKGNMSEKSLNPLIYAIIGTFFSILISIPTALNDLEAHRMMNLDGYKTYELPIIFLIVWFLGLNIFLTFSISRFKDQIYNNCYLAIDEIKFELLNKKPKYRRIAKK